MGQRTSACFPVGLPSKPECDVDHSLYVGAWCVRFSASGNSTRMSDEGAREGAERYGIPRRTGDYEDALWGEAAGLIQAELDSDVYLEAQGLMVAEMADVTLAERLGAVESGQMMRVELASGEVLRGPAAGGSSGLCQLHVGGSTVIIPVHSVLVVSPLPRVLHSDDLPHRSWRSTLRTLLGHPIDVRTHGRGEGRYTGRLAWVGSDHISLTHSQLARDEVTIAWSAVERIDVTGNVSSKGSC